VASDDQKMRQRDALTAETFSDVSEKRNSSRASIVALQSHLAQLTQPHPHSEVPGLAPNVVVGEQYLVFWLLGHECALKAEYIQGVERLVDITPVPNVAPWVYGVMNLRGSIASVVDLRTFLDMEQLPYNPHLRLLSVYYNEMVICLVVDGVSDMVPIADTAIAGIDVRQTTIPQWAVPYATGSVLLDTRVLVLLDAARLLFSEKMQRYEALD